MNCCWNGNQNARTTSPFSIKAEYDKTILISQVEGKLTPSWNNRKLKSNKKAYIWLFATPDRKLKTEKYESTKKKTKTKQEKNTKTQKNWEMISGVLGVCVDQALQVTRIVLQLQL